MEMLEDLDRETVDWMPNYSNTTNEPVCLPGKFPNLLCNGTTGIAVGMATNMPPHNLHEVCDAILHRIDHPDSTLEEIMTLLPGPDFPTYGIIMGTQGIKSAYSTGRGSVVMQAKTMIEPGDSGKSLIVITELPYQVNKANLSGQQGQPRPQHRRHRQEQKVRRDSPRRRLFGQARNADRSRDSTRRECAQGAELPP